MKYIPDALKDAYTGDLIDAGQLWHVVCNTDKPEDVPEDTFFRSLVAVLVTILEAMPMLREPPYCAEWVYDEYAYAHCSACGYEQEERETVTPFCPECGRRMEEENE